MLLVAGGPIVRSAQAVHADDGPLVFAIDDSLTIGMSPFLPSRMEASGWGPVTRINAFKSHQGHPHQGGHGPDGRARRGHDQYGDISATPIPGSISRPRYGTNDTRISWPTGAQIIRDARDNRPGHHVLWVNVHLPHSPGAQQASNTALDHKAAKNIPSQSCSFSIRHGSPPVDTDMAADEVRLHRPPGTRCMASEVATASESDPVRCRAGDVPAGETAACLPAGFGGAEGWC